MSASGCVDSVPKTVAEELEHITAAFFVVFGMDCPRCEARVRNSLLSVKGVVEAYVDYIGAMAQVVFNPDLTNVPTLVATVDRTPAESRHGYWAVYLG